MDYSLFYQRAAMKKIIILFMLLISTATVQSQSYSYVVLPTIPSLLVKATVVGASFFTTVCTFDLLKEAVAQTKHHGVKNPIQTSLSVVLVGYAWAELYNWGKGNDLYSVKAGKKLSTFWNTSAGWFVEKYHTLTLDRLTKRIALVEKELETRAHCDSIIQFIEEFQAKYKTKTKALRLEIKNLQKQNNRLQKQLEVSNFTCKKIERLIKDQFGTTI